MERPLNLYLASGNGHKLGEFAAIFASGGLPLNFYSAAIVGGMPDVDENAGTFEGNAMLKAQALLPRIGNAGWSLADDSGLVVDALGGEPGVHSARYAGPRATAADNNRKLLDALRGVPPAERTARFVCCLVMVDADGRRMVATGTCEGRILEEGHGAHGFGYDPLFLPEGHTASMAALAESLKNRISHRARAVQALIAQLRESIAASRSHTS